MINEIQRWEAAGVEASLKEDGPFREQADRLTALFDKGVGISSTTSPNGNFHVIKEFPFSHTDKSGAVSMGTACLMRPEGGPSSLPDIACLIAFDDGSKKRVTLRTDTGIALDADRPEEEFKGKRLINSIINSADKSIELSERARRIRRRNLYQYARNGAVGLVAAGGLALAGYGIVKGFEAAGHTFKDAINDIGNIFRPSSPRQKPKNNPINTAADKAHRGAFDSSGYKLPGSYTGITQSKIKFISQAAYNQVPAFKTSDDLRSPRLVGIPDADSCVNTEAPINSGDSVVISDVYGSNDDIVPFENKGGALSVCELNSNLGQGWNVVIQVQDDASAPIANTNIKGAKIGYITEHAYDNIPTAHLSDNLRNARRITISDPETCVDTSAPLKNGDRVSTSDVWGNNDDIVAARNKGGSLSICRLDDSNTSWEVAVQITKP